MPRVLALAQTNCTVGDIKGNTRQIMALAVRARDVLGAGAVIFPELCLCGYPPEDLLLRPEFLDDVEQALDTICQQIQGIDLVIGYPRRKAGRLYNAAGVIHDGEIIAEYFKTELPNYSVFDEKRYFSPGDQACVVEVAGIPVGLSVCEDIWYTGPARKAAEVGARLILNLNASPYQAGKGREREQVVAQRARETGLPVVYVNLVGGQDELVFDGGSFCMNGQGSMCQRSRFFGEALDVLLLDDHGVPLEAEIAQCPDEESMVYAALVLGVRDYVRKAGFQGVVLGLSGGIDSALTLAIAVDALGAEQVEVVLMPSRYTADMSNEDALEQARRMGVKHSIIPIEPAFQAFLKMLEEEFAGQPMDVTEENIQARCRGIILMAISNKSGRMLLTTGNKSEMSVGYATLYGDMAGGFAPLKDVFKSLVYRLARWRNRNGEVIPERVIIRPPSAELRPEQQDTDSLPPYDILDEILRRYVEEDQGIREIIAAGFDQATVQRITRMVDINEYKRRQAPPGVKVTRRAYGRDRRYPIVNGYH
ncbi:NAD+ synthase [Thiolapillus brandeum]|uniref:Glutamine-dependent NAD(+) synthetase n=1 Tax=Thiolapillus brandeum TaxID=1076588 RepID=A0A7U6GKI0_9GAMM|nr:NAD+ synthase [Thiolapillus brandeum]BAO45273.1 NAD+ synthase (glutamine-hydrolysing) [Thiolapillus brandeum]